MERVIRKLKFIAQSNPNMTPEQQQEFQGLKNKLKEYFSTYKEYERRGQEILEFYKRNRYKPNEEEILAFIWLPQRFKLPGWVYKYLDKSFIDSKIEDLIEDEKEDLQIDLPIHFGNWIRKIIFPKGTNLMVVLSKIKSKTISDNLESFKDILDKTQKFVADLEKEKNPEKIKRGLKVLRDEMLWLCEVFLKGVIDTFESHEKVLRDSNKIKQTLAKIFAELVNKIENPIFWKEQIERYYLRKGKPPPEIKEAGFLDTY